MAEINGILVRELRCKNDACRRLICYERHTMDSVAIIVYVCPKCETISEFRFNYGKGRQDIDKLIDVMKGGE